MILQPLVENSIKHGLGAKGRRGPDHDPRAAREPDTRSSKWWTTASACRATGWSRSREHGIGLRNVNERLRVIYGANYQLQLHSVPGQGTLGAHRNPRARRAGARDRLSR